MKKNLAARVLSLVAFATWAALPAGAAVTVTDLSYSLSGPLGLAVDAFGNVWVSDVTELRSYRSDGFNLANRTVSVLGQVATEPFAGAVWVADTAGNRVARFQISGGSPIYYNLPTASSQPKGIVFGPDGGVWFTEFGSNKIGTVSALGGLHEYPLPHAGSQPLGITVGSDEALWFTEYAGNRIGRITTTGVIEEFDIPTAGAYPTGIAPADGYVYFTETGKGKIGRYAFADYFDEYPVLSANASVQQIVIGPDGAYWFTEKGSNMIGRLAFVNGVSNVTEYPIPTANAQPTLLTATPRGEIWFVEEGPKKIARLQFHVPGDANGDGLVTVADVFYVINFLFAGGPAPK